MEGAEELVKTARFSEKVMQVVRTEQSVTQGHERQRRNSSHLDLFQRSEDTDVTDVPQEVSSFQVGLQGEVGAATDGKRAPIIPVSVTNISLGHR